MSNFIVQWWNRLAGNIVDDSHDVKSQRVPEKQIKKTDSVKSVPDRPENTSMSGGGSSHDNNSSGYGT